MPDPAVLDTSVVLALLFEEPGAQIVARLLNDPTLIGTVNLAEAHAKLIERGRIPDDAWIALRSLGCEIVPLLEDHARIAAELITITRRLGLSLGDRACLALAIERKAKVYTADRNWKDLSLDIEIEVIR